MSNYDRAVDMAQSNESGAVHCYLSDKVELLISDRGETFTVWDYRPNAKRPEKPVSALWAHKFLNRALGVRIENFEW